MPKKDRTYGPLTIEGYDTQGQAWAWWKPYSDNQDPKLAVVDDRIFFDPRHNCPGDVVESEYHGKRQGQFQGKQCLLIQPSSIRRQPPCPHFGICGGCSYQHLDYSTQCQVKEDMVRECFSDWKEETEFLPLLAAESEFRYRNKMEFTAAIRSYQTEAPDPAQRTYDHHGSLGFFVPYTGNKVLDVSSCLLQSPQADAILCWFRGYSRRKGWAHYNHKNHQGFFRTLLIRSLNDGQILVMPVFAYDDQDEIQACLTELRSHFPRLDSIWYLVNTKLNDTYADLVPVHHSGKAVISEHLDGIEFGIGPQTFYQVNSDQCLNLYRQVIQMADINANHLVYDLYCGVGTMSCLSARKAHKVVGIEYVESSVSLARTYSKQAGLDNTHFFAGDMKDVLGSDSVTVLGKPDRIILDPPRAGLHPSVSRYLADHPCPRMVYVSCNMESLKRDLVLLSRSYRICSIQGVDLMPQTPHVEVIALLEAKEPKK